MPLPFNLPSAANAFLDTSSGNQAFTTTSLPANPIPPSGNPNAITPFPKPEDFGSWEDYKAARTAHMSQNAGMTDEDRARSYFNTAHAPGGAMDLAYGTASAPDVGNVATPDVDNIRTRKSHERNIRDLAPTPIQTPQGAYGPSGIGRPPGGAQDQLDALMRAGPPKHPQAAAPIARQPYTPPQVYQPSGQGSYQAPSYEEMMNQARARNSNVEDFAWKP